MTHTQRVLEHLEKYGSITTWDAISLYGITRLSAYIHILRKEYDITTKKETTLNRYGKQVNFLRYILKNA